ncbi:MAG TPA: ROK family transcriptional regulator [Treponemataceae bacterium]|nr:ROK family transcriptional regulator [Treponemataceae bacterium]
MTSQRDNALRASDVRQHNEKMVLSLIHKAGKTGISQSEVVQETGLKAPTVFRIFNYLEEDGLIAPITENTQEATNKKGRKPLAYTVKPEAKYTIGIEFWAECITIGVFNFAGELIHTGKLDLETGIAANEATSKIISLVREFTARLDIPADKYLGVGVAAPGQVNIARREIVYYPRIRDMRNFPVADILEESLGMNVYLHNNCSAIALSEYRYGGYRHGDALFTFLIRSGVNGAFVSQNRIYITSQSTTLESGHIPISLDGPLCDCGQKGCLQAYMTGLNTILGTGSPILLEGIDERLRAGDYAAVQALDDAARYLYAAVKTVIRFFRPKAFLFVCTSKEAGERISRIISRLREEQSSGFDLGVIDFFSHTYSELTALRGASDLVLDAYFS